MSDPSNNRVCNIFSTAVTYASRLVCVVCIVWTGMIVIQTFKLFSPAASRADNTHPVANLTFAHPSLLLPQDGFWSFGESSLDIQSRHVSTRQLEEQLDRQLSPANHTASDIDASPLIALAQLNNAVRKDVESVSTWTIQNDGLRVLLSASQTEPPYLITALVAQKTGDNWELFEFGKQKAVNLDSGHLLPLAQNSVRLCSRRSTKGHLLMELIQVNAPGTSLLQLWRDAGWQIRHSQFGSQRGFSYLCVKDNRVVYAWSATANGTRMLMLSKTDDVDLPSALACSSTASSTSSTANSKRTGPKP